MNDDLREELRSEIEDFHAQTKQLLDRELNVKEFKGYSGGFGSYAQRGTTSFMLRLRINRGTMTRDKLKFICGTCKEHRVSRAHSTTCQTIQLHGLNGTEIPSIMSNALDHDIICRGDGGDFPHNIMCSPLSGVDLQETFDVLPCAARVDEYLLSIVNKYTLLHKLKAALTNSSRNEAHVTFHNLDFVANPDHAFDVYCAGGLGNNPRMGVRMGEHVVPETILYYVPTMILVFIEFGNYRNRTRIRTRYIQETLGSEGSVDAYRERLKHALQGRGLTIAVHKEAITKIGDAQMLSDHRAFVQKQYRLYTVYYRPTDGNLTPQKLQEICDCIRDVETVELRLILQQSVYIVSCTTVEAKCILTVIGDGARNTFEENTACIRTSTYQVGLRDSQDVPKNVILYLKEENYTNHVLPEIFISGCPSSCGANQIGQLGFQEMVEIIDHEPYPIFTLGVSSNDSLYHKRSGNVTGVVLEGNMRLFLVAIVDAVTAAGMNFNTWLEKERERLDAILNTYLR